MTAECGWWIVSGQPVHAGECPTCRASTGGPDYASRTAEGLGRLRGESDEHWAWRMRRADRERGRASSAAERGLAAAADAVAAM